MRTLERAGILAVVVVAFLSVWPADAQLAETPASAWMELERSHRTAFAIGFLSGVQHTLQRIGMDLRLREGVTADELSTAVHTKLLAEPVLGLLPIGLVIMDALTEYVTITDRDGNPIE
jgi:hypothetical protein